MIFGHFVSLQTSVLRSCLLHFLILTAVFHCELEMQKHILAKSLLKNAKKRLTLAIATRNSSMSFDKSCIWRTNVCKNQCCCRRLLEIIRYKVSYCVLLALKDERSGMNASSGMSLSISSIQVRTWLAFLFLWLQLCKILYRFYRKLTYFHPLGWRKLKKDPLHCKNGIQFSWPFVVARSKTESLEKLSTKEESRAPRAFLTDAKARLVWYTYHLSPGA